MTTLDRGMAGQQKLTCASVKPSPGSLLGQSQTPSPQALGNSFHPYRSAGTKNGVSLSSQAGCGTAGRSAGTPSLELSSDSSQALGPSAAGPALDLGARPAQNLRVLLDFSRSLWGHEYTGHAGLLWKGRLDKERNALGGSCI